MNIPNLTKAIEVGITAGVNEWEDSKVHASDLSKVIEGEGCKRQLWLRTHGFAKKPLSLGQRIMFSNAYSIHERVPEWLKAGFDADWRVKEVETEIEGQEGTGRLDILVEHIPSGEIIVVDVKSVRGKAFDYLTKPKVPNVVQLQTYLRAKGAKIGILLYIDREGQNGTREFTVLRDDAFIGLLWQQANEVVSLKDPPPVLEPELEVKALKTKTNVKLKMPWHCSYCPFLDISCDGALGKSARDLTGEAIGNTIIFNGPTPAPILMSKIKEMYRNKSKVSAQAPAYEEG